MRHPAQHLVVLASARVPWLIPAVGLAVFVHKHFISYQGQGSAAARAKASSRPRPPKLRRASKKAKSAKDRSKRDADCVADAEQDQLDAVGLSSDKLMEWFTEDEVEALQQAQAHPAAFMSLLSGTRFMADEQCDASDDASGWCTDKADQHWLQDLGHDSHDSYNDSYNNSRRSSEGEGFSIKPLPELTKALSHSSDGYSTATSPNDQQQQWQASQQLLQQLAEAMQQEQQSAAAADEAGSESSAADYFDPSHYYGLSPAANTQGRASLDLMQGGYLPRAGALWASSPYPPHLDELDDLDSLDDAYEQEELAQQQMQSLGRQLGTYVTNTASSNEQQQQQQGNKQQQQQQRQQSAARWFAEYEPPAPDFEPEFDINLDYDFDYDYEPDYVPEYVPDFGDDLGFDQLDGVFAAAAAQA